MIFIPKCEGDRGGVSGPRGLDGAVKEPKGLLLHTLGTAHLLRPALLAKTARCTKPQPVVSR